MLHYINVALFALVAIAIVIAALFNILLLQLCTIDVSLF